MSGTVDKIFNREIMENALGQFGAISVQNFLLFSLIGILIVILIALVCKLIGKEVRLSDVLTGIMLAVYCSVILQLTLVCRQDNSRIGMELDIFHGLRGGDNEFHWLMISYAALNSLLFVPYGFIISLFSFVNNRKAPVQMLLVTLTSLIASISIEVSQFITGRGYYEIQDMVFNTLGGFIGWILFAIIYNIGRRIVNRNMER